MSKYGQKALNWLQVLGNPYEAIAYDPTGKLGMEFGVYGAPETFLIDPKGIIRYKVVGPMSPRVWEDELKPKIEELRKENS